MLLELDGITTYRGPAQILRGVSLAVNKDEVVCLVGRNGAGRTTIIESIMGLLPIRSGTIRFGDADITHLPPHKRAKCGIGYASEDTGIFPELTVAENLTLAQREGGWPMEEINQLFPKLKTRRDARGENLSGGERQMLAIARALCAPQRLILLDEPFEGLAPSVVAEVLAAIGQLRHKTSILLVEHKVDLVLDLADRAYIMVNGQISYAGDSSALQGDADTQNRLLGVRQKTTGNAP